MNSGTRLERYDFTSSEVDQLGRELGQQVAKVARLRQEKKDTVADLSERIKEAEARCYDLADKITTGFEMREVRAQGMLGFTTKQ